MAKPNRLKLKFCDDSGREETRREHVTGLRLDFTSRWGQDAVINLGHLADRPAFAKAIAKALAGMSEPDGTIKKLITLVSYVRIINCYLWPFLSHLEDQDQPIQDTTCVSTATLRSLIEWLRLKDIRERTAYCTYLCIARLFTYLINNYPETVSPNLDVPMYPGRHLKMTVVHREPYSPREASEIERAASSEISKTLARLRRGTELRLTGSDPRIAGWHSEANLLWYVENVLGKKYLSKKELEEGRHWVFLKAIEKNSANLSDIYKYIYPTIGDLVPLIVLLTLKTGLNPQSIFDLGRNCLKAVPAPGKISIIYTKHRPGPKPNILNKIVDNRAPLGAGGIIRTALKLTEPCVPQVSEEFRNYLFIGLMVSRGTSGFRRPRDSKDIKHELNNFSARNLLQDDEGLPLRLNLSRLRPTYLTKRYKAAGYLSDVRAEAKHKKARTTRGYIDNTQTKAIHEQTIIEGLQDFYNAVSGTVLTQSPEDPKQVAQAAELLGVSSEHAEAVLRGEQDVFIAACKDFYNRPGGVSNAPCDRPWACFTCQNACWTRGTLPRLISFYDFIVGQRHSLTAADWKAKFGLPYAIITEHILPAFPAESVEAARAAASTDKLIVPISLKTV